MDKYTKEEIKNIIKELGAEQPWHHNIELPYGLWTSPERKETYAKNIKKWSRLESIIGRVDLQGARVLDVGCSEGYYSFKISKLGASEVIAIDLNELRLKKAKFVKDALKIDNVAFKKMDIMDIGEHTLGRFDLVLCFGFLHRFPDPYGLLKRLSSLSNMIALEWKIPRVHHNSLPIMTFATTHIQGCDRYNISYWYPTITCVMEILKREGFGHHSPIDDGRDKRVALVSARQSLALKNGGYRIKTRNIVYLIFKYTTIYLKTIYRIMVGKIRA